MLSFGNMDKRIHFRFSRRANLQEIITAQNEMPIPSKSIPTLGCKDTNFPYPNLVFLIQVLHF